VSEAASHLDGSGTVDHAHDGGDDTGVDDVDQERGGAVLPLVRLLLGLGETA
jgi:hypothetical protein